MTNYAAFKTFLQTHLWKTGDSVLTSALDNLIRMGTAQLNRDLLVEQRSAMIDVDATSRYVPFPLNCHSIRSIFIPVNGEASYVTPTDFNQIVSQAGTVLTPFYTTNGKTILLSGSPSIDVPLSIRITYYENLPDFKAAGASWVYDDFPDVYLYAVLKHTGPFLREDERVGLWAQLAGEALQSALVSNDDVKYSGSPLSMRMTGIA